MTSSPLVMFNRHLGKKLVFPCLLLLLFVSCAKKPINIGRENPEQEIKKCIKFSEKKHFQEAVECLEIFKSHFPKSQWGIEAELSIGDNYFRQKEYLLAADSYQSFVKLHPTHPKIDYAYYKSGLSYLRQSPKAIDRDQEYLDDSIANFEIVIRNFSESPYINIAKTYYTEARTKIAKRSFYVGRFYYRTGEYLAAIPRFQEIPEKYNDSGLAPKSLYFITLANIRLKKLDDAKVSFSKLSLSHPDSKYIPVLEKKMIKAVKRSSCLPAAVGACRRMNDQFNCSWFDPLRRSFSEASKLTMNAGVNYETNDQGNGRAWQTTF